MTTATKVCTKCQQSKSEDDFALRSIASQKRFTHCKECQRRYNDGHYSRTRQKRIASARVTTLQTRQTNQQRLMEYLRLHPCVDCPEDDPVVLDFDHVDPSIKTANVPAMVRWAYSWETILKEIEKCVVRCANCHRRRTATQFKNYRRVA